MILLKAIVDSIDDEDLKEDIFESYLINRRCPESLRIKLKPMKEDARNFQRLIDNQINDMEETQIFNNYKLFKELLKESILSPEQIYEGVQKLEIVYIELNEQKENPQLIFESLNSTGLDLTQADLIRNYLLMGKEYYTQEALYNKYWLKLEKMLPDAMISDYIRDYLTLKTGNIPNKDDVYSSFKGYYRELENYDSEGFLEELTTYGEYYSWFKFCNCPDININRRLLCEMPTNALNKVFATMAKDVERFSGMALSEKVICVLSGKKGKVIFPNDNILKEHMMTRNAYKFPHIKFVLEQIERNKSKETVTFDSLTIEHIMPQTLTAKWKIDLGKRAQEIYDKYLHCLGNLTLSGYNSELSNASFNEKQALYSKSNICITKSIAQYDHWGETEILNRGETLIEDIKKIWICPDTINNINLEVDTRTEFDFTDEVNVTGRTPVELEIIGEVFSVTSWRDFMKKVCEFLYEYDAQVFRSLTKHNDFKGKSIRIIDDNDSNMRSPLKIAEGLYIETNRSANDILNYCKLIIEKFDGVEELSSYKLKAI